MFFQQIRKLETLLQGLQFLDVDNFLNSKYKTHPVDDQKVLNDAFFQPLISR